MTTSLVFKGLTCKGKSKPWWTSTKLQWKRVCLGFPTNFCNHGLIINLLFLTLLRAQESLTMEARAKSIPVPKAKSAPTAAKAKAKVKAKAKPDAKPAAKSKAICPGFLIVLVPWRPLAMFLIWIWPGPGCYHNSSSLETFITAIHFQQSFRIR